MGSNVGLDYGEEAQHDAEGKGTTLEYAYYDDVAEQTRDDLGFDGFAMNIASGLQQSMASDDTTDESIRRLRQGHSIVAGIEGPWGCGKTTMANFIRRHLRQNDAGMAFTPIVVDFPLWEYQTSEAATAMLFSKIADELMSDETRKEIEKREKLLDAMNKAGELTNIASSVFSQLSGIVRTLDALTQIMQVLGNKDDADLPETKAELAKQLSLMSKDFCIFVFIDDIGRLNNQGIASLFKTVKTVGDLPRICYVLLYDRQVIAQSLNTVSADGQEYLSKIVQFPIPVPKVPSAVIMDWLSNELAYILHVEDPDFERIRPILLMLVHTLRDAKRLLNTVVVEKLQLGSACDNADLTAITALQLFEPGYYDWLYQRLPLEDHDSLDPPTTKEGVPIKNWEYEGINSVVSDDLFLKEQIDLFDDLPARPLRPNGLNNSSAWERYFTLK